MSETAHFTIESICIVSAALTVGVDVWYIVKMVRRHDEDGAPA